jgi:two-component system, chemotaxis family, protein-glutamate methylesterase/glutaminase
VPQYRCRVGHAYTADTFVTAQTTRVENALWTALRALEERAALHRRIAARNRKSGNSKSAERFERRADDSVENAVVLRELLSRFVADEGAA